MVELIFDNHFFYSKLYKDQYHGLLGETYTKIPRNSIEVDHKIHRKRCSSVKFSQYLNRSTFDNPVFTVSNGIKLTQFSSITVTNHSNNLYLTANEREYIMVEFTVNNN